MEGASATSPGLRSPYRIDVPAGATGEIEYWFKLTTEEGHEHDDSNFGHNLHTNIVPAGGTTVKFDDLWGESTSGPIREGSTLRLTYDVDRIKPFLKGTSHHEAATWSAAAFVSFDGKPPQEVPLTAVRTGDYGFHKEIEPVEGLVEVPHDAKSVTVYIHGRAYGGTAYDSDFGKNYTFPVEPANG